MAYKLSQISNLLKCDVICGEEFLDMEVDHCFCADLMSDVLAYSQENTVLLTGLTNAQSVRTANVADIKAVIFLRGKIPDDLAIECAKENEIPLLSTKLDSINACGLIYSIGIKDKE